MRNTSRVAGNTAAASNLPTGGICHFGRYTSMHNAYDARCIFKAGAGGREKEKKVTTLVESHARLGGKIAPLGPFFADVRERWCKRGTRSAYREERTLLLQFYFAFLLPWAFFLPRLRSTCTRTDAPGLRTRMMILFTHEWVAFFLWLLLSTQEKSWNIFYWSIVNFILLLKIHELWKKNLNHVCCWSQYHR